MTIMIFQPIVPDINNYTIIPKKFVFSADFYAKKSIIPTHTSQNSVVRGHESE